jgi:hypothetical protein
MALALKFAGAAGPFLSKSGLGKSFSRAACSIVDALGDRLAHKIRGSAPALSRG